MFFFLYLIGTRQMYVYAVLSYKVLILTFIPLIYNNQLLKRSMTKWNIIFLKMLWLYTKKNWEKVTFVETIA